MQDMIADEMEFMNQKVFSKIFCILIFANEAKWHTWNMTELIDHKPYFYFAYKQRWQQGNAKKIAAKCPFLLRSGSQAWNDMGKI